MRSKKGILSGDLKKLLWGAEIIVELLSLAQMAPSAGNLQSRDFVIVTDKTTKKKLAAAALDQSFIKQAPVVIVFVANFERASRRVRVQRGTLCDTGRYSKRNDIPASTVARRS